MAGNIINNGYLVFRSNNQYNGIISGYGHIIINDNAVVVLNGVNTYTGGTYIKKGTLALGPKGSIENSYIVSFYNSIATAKLDVTAGNKKIKNIRYQWFANSKNSNAGGTMIKQENSQEFVLPANLTAGTIYYYCRASATGAITIYSDVATVHVAPAN